MKYSQPRAASEELLRLTLQKMAAHPAAFTPYTYAVWYEHIMGINPGLSKAIEDLLDNDRTLDDDTISRLYEQHVSECKQEINRILREDMKHLLSKLIDVASETDRHTQDFGNNLQSYGDQLRSRPNLDLLAELVDRMESDTRNMHGSVSALHTELEQSKDEVGKLQQELESARREALIDPLTGIYNRRGFEMQLQTMLAEAISVEKGLCVLMVDIDDFKKINDTYGHLFGDRVLCTLANTLKSKIKGQDSVARLGGEEFAVLLPETSLSGALAVAEQIRASIQRGKIRRPNSKNEMGNITVSIGVADFSKGITLVEWLDRADKALYQSKKQGKNRVTPYSAESQADLS